MAVDPTPVEAVAAAHQEHVPHLIVGLVNHQEADVELATDPSREILILVIDPVAVVRRQHDPRRRPVLEVVALGVAHGADVAMVAAAVDLVGKWVAGAEVANILLLLRIPAQHGGGVGHVGGVLHHRLVIGRPAQAVRRIGVHHSTGGLMAARTVDLALRLVATLRVRIAGILEDVVEVGFTRGTACAEHFDDIVLLRAVELDQPQIGLFPVEAVGRRSVTPGPAAIRERGWQVPHLEEGLFFVVEDRLTYELHISGLAAPSALFPGPVRHDDGIAGVLVGPVHVVGDAAGLVDEQVVEEVLLAIADIEDAG